MKRKLLFPFPVSQLILCCLFVSSVTGQTFDIQKALVGEWRAPRVSFEGKTYPLKIVFSRGSGKLRALVARNMDFGEDQNPRFYTAADLKLSENRLSFSLEGPKPTVFYEGELSSTGETLTMHFTFVLPSKPDTRITWNLTRAPLCNHPEELEAAIKNVWETGNYADALTALPNCFPADLYEDKISLLRGLVILKGGDFAINRYRNLYEINQRYDDSLSLFNRSLKLNSQNPIGSYAAASVHYERALEVIKEMNSLIEWNNKEPPNRRLPDRQIEEKKNQAKRKALSYLNMSIGAYSSIISNDAFDTKAYVRRAQMYYAAWSKCEPDPEFLESALKDYKAAIELNPLSYELFYERALIYKYLGDTEKYETDMKRVEELKVNK